jgi:hypothetical protein
MLNAKGHLYESHSLRTSMEVDHEAHLLYENDASELFSSCSDYEPRLQMMGTSAETLVEMLRGHPLVEIVHYPKYASPVEYLACTKAKKSISESYGGGQWREWSDWAEGGAGKIYCCVYLFRTSIACLVCFRGAIKLFFAESYTHEI